MRTTKPDSNRITSVSVSPAEIVKCANDDYLMRRKAREAAARRLKFARNDVVILSSGCSHDGSKVYHCATRRNWKRQLEPKGIVFSP